MLAWYTHLMDRYYVCRVFLMHLISHQIGRWNILVEFCILCTFFLHSKWKILMTVLLVVVGSVTFLAQIWTFLSVRKTPNVWLWDIILMLYFFLNVIELSGFYQPVEGWWCFKAPTGHNVISTATPLLVTTTQSYFQQYSSGTLILLAILFWYIHRNIQTSK